MSSKAFDAIGIESPCIDFALNVDQLPSPNLGAELFDYSWQGGGKLSTGMLAAARLGARCALMGPIGDDVFSRSCLHDFERHGVITSHLKVKEGTTSLSVVISDHETHGRSIIHKAGSASEITEADVDFSLLAQAKYFYLSKFTDINIKACRLAREQGVKVFMDADSYRPGMEEFIPLVDVFVASEFVYDALFGDRDFEKNCRKTRDMGPSIAVYTFGEKGCCGMGEEGYFFLPAYQVPVTDTLGAGDVFHGAFLAGLLRGWGAEETARFASAVAAIKCTSPGGRSGIPTFEAALRFMETGELPTKESLARLEFYRRGLENIE